MKNLPTLILITHLATGQWLSFTVDDTAKCDEVAQHAAVKESWDAVFGKGMWVVVCVEKKRSEGK